MRRRKRVDRPAHRPLLRVLASARLTLVAASPDLIGSDLAGTADLATALDAEVPPEWPPELFSNTVMRVAQAQLLDPSEQGWSIWYLLLKGQQRPSLVGLCQFKGRPDPSGSVEIAYSILPGYQNRGFATEAVARLVEWAFGHRNVVQVAAETLPHRKRSIRIMEKNGFVFDGPGSEQGVVRYVLRKTSGR